MPVNSSVGVIQVEGPEARKFLQALVSSDVDELKSGSSQTSLLLTPAGKLVGAFWIYCKEDELFLIVCESSQVSRVSENLTKFLIRTKAQVSDVSESFTAHVGDDLESSDEIHIVEPNYLGVSGLTVAIGSRMEIDEKSKELLDWLRISYGALSVDADLSEEIIPQEGNLQKSAVSFSKGCFLGQELVCRIDSRQASTPHSIFAFESAEPLVMKGSGDKSFDLSINSEKIATASSILIKNPTIEKELQQRNLGTGNYCAIARVPRKIADLLASGETVDVSIGAQGDTSRTKIVSWQKVPGLFSI